MKGAEARAAAWTGVSVTLFFYPTYGVFRTPHLQMSNALWPPTASSKPSNGCSRPILPPAPLPWLHIAVSHLPPPNPYPAHTHTQAHTTPAHSHMHIM